MVGLTLSLFAVPVSIFKIEDINYQAIKKLLTNMEYKNIGKDTDHSLISKTLNILNEYDELNALKIKINKAIKNFSEIVMSNQQCEFALTSSWATQSKRGQRSDAHVHSNNMYSAVYYNTDIEHCGAIRFYQNKSLGSFQLTPRENTTVNSDYWDIPVKEKTLIVFPSYLQHSILRNNSDQIRYSIACNYHPIGLYGESDSEVFNLGFKNISKIEDK